MPGHTNKNQTQNNNQLAQSRKIAGTGDIYTGMVVKLGEFEYTTVGGGIEGDRQQLQPLINNTPDSEENLSNQVTPSESNMTDTSNAAIIPNPVTRIFNSEVVYYRPSGIAIPIGSVVHEHQDGTIMGGDPRNPQYDMNNPNNILSTTRPTSDIIPSSAQDNSDMSGDDSRDLIVSSGGY